MMFNESQVGSGLTNPGTACYINSTLQALFHIPSFYNLLVNDSKHQLCENECLVCDMRKTLAHCQAKSGAAFQPDLIHKKLKFIAPHLNLHQQEDSQEFLMYLIQGMQKSYLEADKLNLYSEETTPINQLFGFEICTERACSSCLHVSTRYEHSTELSLAMQHYESLHEVLNAYFQEELLQGENLYECQNCGQKVKGTQRNLVNKPPNVLQLLLKRFAYDGTVPRKLTHKVLVPQQLELGKYLSISSPVDYKLVSATFHHGSTIERGHYTCIGSTCNGVFHVFDDEKVYPVSPHPDLFSEAYVLMYERTGPGNPKPMHGDAPQADFKYSQGAYSNVKRTHLDTKVDDGWETVTGRYKNRKPSIPQQQLSLTSRNLKSAEILLPNNEGKDKEESSPGTKMDIKNRFHMSATPPPSLSSIHAETSSSAVSQTIGDENNCKPTTAERKGLIEEKAKDRPSISTVGGVYRNQEVEVKTIRSKKSNSKKINWQNVACALNNLNISVVKVINLKYTDFVFKDICKFLGKECQRYESNLYNIYKTCRRFYHEIHLNEGILTCDSRYCKGTQNDLLVDPLLQIAKCQTPSSPVTTKCQTPSSPVTTQCQTPSFPVTTKCQTPPYLTTLMSLNNESPQKTQDTLNSDTDTFICIEPKSSFYNHVQSFFKRNEISIEDDSHVQEEEETRKSSSNMTLDDIFEFADSSDGDESLSPKVSTSDVFVKPLSDPETSEQIDMIDLEDSYRTPVRKYLTYNEQDVDIGEERVLTNSLKSCVNTPDTSLIGTSLQKTSLHKDESYIQGNNTFITPNAKDQTSTPNAKDQTSTPNTKDQTSNSASNMTLNDCDEEAHSSTPRVSTERKVKTRQTVKRKLFKSKLSPFKRAFFTPTPVKSTARLPFGTKNQFGLKHNEAYLGREKKTFANIKFKEGEVVLPNSDWKRLIDEGTGNLDDFVYPTMICGKYLQAVNNTCVIKAKSKRRTKTNFVVYAQCLHKYCKSFKINCSIGKKESNSSTMKIELFSGGLHYLHNPTEQRFRQARGVERLIHGQELKEKAADSYRDTIVTNTRNVKVDAGNMDHIKHLSTFQKIRSEFKLSEDLDRDDYVDMCMMMKSMKECKIEDDLKSDYIQSVVEYPFTVHLYSKEQGDVIRLLQDTNRSITAHIDSTGNLVRKSTKTSKSVFYYVLLINVPEDIKFQHEDKSHKKERSGTLFPVAEMITADHTISSVLAWLTLFHFFVYKNCKVAQPLFTNIVSDQSFALLNAISFTFNDSTTIFVYLNMCHKVLTDQMQLSDRTTIINLCCTHYVKTIMRTMEPFFPGKNNRTRDRIMLMIALLFNCKHYADVQVWFRYFVIILCSKTMSSQFENAYNVLAKTLVKNQTHEYDTNEIPTLAYPPDMLEYEDSGKSAIYTEFLDISNEVQQNLIESTCNTKNEFYNPKYVSCFLKRHVPYIPMFTPVMISKREIPCRQSNANVESYFSQVKNYIHVGPQAEKCSRFVKNIRKNVIEPKLKMIKLGIQSHQSYKKRTYKRKTSLNAVEMWRKKQRKYVKGVQFDPFIAKIERGSAIEKLNAMDTNIPDRDVSDGQKNEVEKHTSVQAKDHTYYQVIDNDILSRNISHPDTENTQQNDGQQNEVEKLTSVQDNEILLLMEDTENTQQNDVQQNEVEKLTSVQDNEISLLMEDTENTQQNECQVQENGNASSERKNREENSDAENVHSQTISNSTISESGSISGTTLYPEYEYSSKVEKVPNERNRHKKNHIVTDLDYYRKYPGKDGSYVVAKVGEIILLQSQLDTLNGNRWLDSEVINYFLCYWVRLGVNFISTHYCFLFLNKHNEIDDNFDLRAAWKLYEKRSLSKQVFANDQFFKTPLFIPLHYKKNHYTLIFLNFQKREFVYLDPLSVKTGNIIQSQLLMKNTLHLIKKIISKKREVTYDLKLQDWKICNEKYTHLPEQKDEYNCGVYVIYYARRIIERLKSLPSGFDVTDTDSEICEKLRPILFEKVLELSESIHDGCIFCWISNKHNTKYVECGRCRNWAHDICLPDLCQERYKKTVKSKPFICGLCL